MLNDDIESHDESGVNIILQPYDDVSSIGDSMTQARMDPDGYTSDEVYTVSTVSNPASTRPSTSEISRGKYFRPSTLLTIREKNIHMESSKTLKTVQHFEEKIGEIMNREPYDRGSEASCWIQTPPNCCFLSSSFSGGSSTAPQSLLPGPYWRQRHQQIRALTGGGGAPPFAEQGNLLLLLPVWFPGDALHPSISINGNRNNEQCDIKNVFGSSQNQQQQQGQQEAGKDGDEGVLGYSLV
jgi:hypothetical protein